LTTTTWRTDGVSRSASSALAFNGAALPRRYWPSAVITSVACASLTRWRSDSAEKPPNTTLCGMPSLAQASMAKTASGIIGSWMATRSPVCRPSESKALAVLATSRRRSA
jgi:hypothetical protein